MSGFREFSPRPAPPDPEVVHLLASARLRVEEPWEEEFVASVQGVVDRGWHLSPKQRQALENLANGVYSDQRESRILDQFNEVRDRNLRQLARDSYDPDRD